MLLLIWIVGGLIGWIMTAIGVSVAVVQMIRHRDRQIPTERPRCVCTHVAEAHEHYRPGTDCGACDVGKCVGYQPAIETGQHIQPLWGAGIRIDGDESGRLVTFRPDGIWGPVDPEVTSCCDPQRGHDDHC